MKKKNNFRSLVKTEMQSRFEETLKHELERYEFDKKYNQSKIDAVCEDISRHQEKIYELLSDVKNVKSFITRDKHVEISDFQKEVSTVYEKIKALQSEIFCHINILYGFYKNCRKIDEEDTATSKINEYFVELEKILKSKIDDLQIFFVDKLDSFKSQLVQLEKRTSSLNRDVEGCFDRCKIILDRAESMTNTLIKEYRQLKRQSLVSEKKIEHIYMLLGRKPSGGEK